MSSKASRPGKGVKDDATVVFLDALVDRWASRATTADAWLPNQSIHSLVGEALELASFVDRFLGAAEGLPGLAQAGLPPEVGAEIRELALAVAHVQAGYRTLGIPRARPPLERAEVVRSELSQALSFVLDAGGVRHPGLARVMRASKSRSRDGLATSLEAFSALSDKHRARFASLPEFDPRLIDEALAIARALRATHAINKMSPDGERRRALRLRLGRLLQDRVSLVRRAARYVFRNHPDVLGLATSQYRREHRGRTEGKKGEPGE